MTTMKTNLAQSWSNHHEIEATEPAPLSEQDFYAHSVIMGRNKDLMQDTLRKTENCLKLLADAHQALITLRREREKSS